MIRTIITVLFVVLFLIVSIPIFFIEWVIGKFNTKVKSRSSLAIVNWAFRVVAFLSGAKVTYLGEENVPKDIPVLYVANHRSFFDIILTYPRVPRPTGYIAKKEIEKVPLLRTWMRNLHCLFLDRSDIKAGLKTILEAIELMKSGISICIFPEGTRNKEADTFLPFHEGSFKIAQKAGCPIIPITINNSSSILEDHMPKIRSSHVIVEYGKPIYINELPPEYKKQVGLYVQQVISETYFKNKELI